MNSLKIGLVAAAALLGVAGGAAAMPLAPLDAPASVQTVRWHCGPYGCRGPGRFYGHRRHWQRGWRWHHRRNYW